MYDPPPPPLPTSRSRSCTLRALAEVNALSSADAPGYPYKNSNNRKNRKRAGGSFPARSLFLSPQPPHDKEASAEERGGNGIYLNERCGAYSILRSSNVVLIRQRRLYIYLDATKNFFF